MVNIRNTRKNKIRIFHSGKTSKEDELRKEKLLYVFSNSK